MLDAADDRVHLRPGDGEDDESSDETQDYRLLEKLSSNGVAHRTLPKRGEKDFEPNPTLDQASTLNASRHAMHNALSFPRLHSSKQHVSGQFKNPIQGDFCVVVENARGPLYQTIGSADGQNHTWLLPEEALWLLERGSLDIRWDVSSFESEAARVDIPMSLQAAYATLIGTSGLSLERYQVYANLRRSGFVLQRASTWKDDISSFQAGTELSASTVDRSGREIADFFRGVVLNLFKSYTRTRSNGPLVGAGIYRDYQDIYRALLLTSSRRPESAPRGHSLSAKSSFGIAYNVYKPATAFKKSSPPNPDFRVAVLDARSTQLLTLGQISAVLDNLPEDAPSQSGRGEVRLKHGNKNVLLAVVDSGVVSYLRISDAIFANEKLYLPSKSRTRKSPGKGAKSRGRRG